MKVIIEAWEKNRNCRPGPGSPKTVEMRNTRVVHHTGRRQCSSENGLDDRIYKVLGIMGGRPHWSGRRRSNRIGIRNRRTCINPEADLGNLN